MKLIFCLFVFLFCVGCGSDVVESHDAWDTGEETLVVVASRAQYREALQRCYDRAGFSCDATVSGEDYLGKGQQINECSDYGCSLLTGDGLFMQDRPDDELNIYEHAWILTRLFGLSCTVGDDFVIDGANSPDWLDREDDLVVGAGYLDADRFQGEADNISVTQADIRRMEELCVSHISGE